MRNLSGSGTFWLDLSSIDDMRSILHELIDHRRARVGDESEASRTTSLTVLHDDVIDELSVLAKVGLERVVVGLVAEASDEHFTELLGLQRAAVIRPFVRLVAVAVLLAGTVLLTVAIAVSVVTRLVLRVAIVRAHIRLVLAVVLLLLLLRLVLL